MTDQTLYDPPLIHPAYARASARRVHSQDVWAAARQLYEAGASGPEVMERYGIGRSAFYQRLRNEGWRRADYDDEPLRDEFDDADAPVAAPAALADEAWRAAARAVQRGRLTEARGWTRLCRELTALAALRAAKPDSPDSCPQGGGGEEQAEAHLTDSTDFFWSAPPPPAAPAPDSMDLTDSISSAPSVQAETTELDPARPWTTRPHDPAAIARLREVIERRRAHGVGAADLPDPDVLEAEAGLSPPGS